MTCGGSDQRRRSPENAPEAASLRAGRRPPSYTAYAPRLHKRARALVMDAADNIFFLANDLRIITESGGFNERTRAAAAPGRFLFTEGKPAFAAKNRYGMPPKIDVPIDFKFSELAKYWDQEVDRVEAA
jgi:hypothetical protein